MRALACAGWAATLALAGKKDVADCPLAPAYQDFKEPPVIKSSSFSVELTTAMLCSPVTGVQWHTRAYAFPSEGIPAMVPGPTIVTKADSVLEIEFKNNLGPKNPTCAEAKQWNERNEKATARSQLIGYNFCHLNTSNFHTHGLHVTPAQEVTANGKTGPSDSIWEVVPPGGSANYVIPINGDHMAGTHWYHPHYHHATSVQAGGGLHGALLVEDPPNSLPPEIEAAKPLVMVISLLDMRFSLNKSWASPATLEKSGAGDLWKALNTKKKGSYVKEDLVVALVNGQWMPKLEIQAGKWYRLRIVFAAIELLLSVITSSDDGMTCSLKLLAKDGIYLHVAPRDIHTIYLASGNRADVLMSCSCAKPGTCEGSLESKTANAQRNTIPQIWTNNVKDFFLPFEHVDNDMLTQQLVKLVVRGGKKPGKEAPALEKFKVRRPCYLPDLRFVPVPVANWARLDFWENPWKVTWTSWFVKFKGVTMDSMDAVPLQTLKTGHIYQFYVRGPNPFGGIAQHPFHTHVLPFQITSLVSTDPYFQNGDWHDTLLHTSAQVVIKMLVGPFVGNHVIHCHILTHEDMGMMTYFKVAGKEGKEWPSEKVDPTCYRAGGKPTYKYLSAPVHGQTANMLMRGSAVKMTPSRPTWIQGPPGQDCHTTCAFLGGCLGVDWPRSGMEMQAITAKLGVHCFPDLSLGSSKHNPSVRHGTCSWRYQSFGGAKGIYRCGANPPSGTARFCPCAFGMKDTPQLM